jgi:hypothetical protein
VIPFTLERHGRFYVVRDDLLPGGTKSRFLPSLLAGSHEVVYAGPPWGGAAVGIAAHGKEMGIAVTLFYPARKTLVARQRLAESQGARLKLIRPGYLSVLKARAREYCEVHGARMLAWGLPQVEAKLAADLARFQMPPDVTEIWVAAGSGTVMRAVKRAWPERAVNGVEVGHRLSDAERAGCRVFTHPLDFEQRTTAKVPFNSCRHYDAKAWEMANAMLGPRAVPLFWNVMGDHR